jgi:hypothetical protein
MRNLPNTTSRLDAVSLFKPFLFAIGIKAAAVRSALHARYFVSHARNAALARYYQFRHEP